MDGKEYIRRVSEEFALSEELTAAVASAQFFIEALGMPEGEILAEMKITKEIYHKHKSLPQS